MRPESQSLPSPFQQTSSVEHHARAVADVAEAQRQEDALEHAVSPTIMASHNQLQFNQIQALRLFSASSQLARADSFHLLYCAKVPVI